MDKKILEKIVATIPLNLEKEFNPKDFFQNKDGLYVYNSFRENILEKSESIKEGTEFKISSFRLAKIADDQEIEKELPEKHLFTESNVCAVISELISKQPTGEEGNLDANCWNLFYTTSFVVVVPWLGSAWGVHAWGRADGRWPAGCRVFSPATDL